MFRKICVVAMVLGVWCGGAVALSRLREYKNRAIVLNSVYDAMKDNVRQSNSLERRDVFVDPRNKRDAQQEVEYYDPVPSESVNEWSVGPVYGNDLVCSRRNEAQTRITVSDKEHSGLTIALIAKYILLVLAALTLPIFIFKVFIIPFKLLVGLKAISLLNSVLLGTLLLKSKFGKYSWPPFTGPYPGATPGSSASASASSSASSSSSSSDEPLDSFNRDEYVDIVQPGDDLKRILDYVKTRNKNW